MVCLHWSTYHIFMEYWSTCCCICSFIQKPKITSQARCAALFINALYQGLKDNVFYWELINTTRKICMIAINALLSTFPLIYSAASAVVVLVFLMRVQLRLHPYKRDLNNRLEMEAMTTGTATLFCGVLFVSDTQDFAIITTVILIVILETKSSLYA